MGVKGLSTFVDNNQRSLLSHHKLHDTKIIIDGNNFMYHLFVHHKVAFKFGGDYDQYSKKCKHFFNMLRSCNIKPYVVFDGGYHPDDRKLKTVLRRRQERIWDVAGICAKGRGSVLPILAIESLKQALEELDVPHISCQFEADREIAVLAHRWRCPVLSNDSDFFIYSLEGGVIPFGYINMTLCVCDIKTEETLVFESKTTLTENQFIYIPVKLYHYSNFAGKYPEDVRELVLPVFGSLLGNDYVDIKELVPFYAHFNVPIADRPKFKVSAKTDNRMTVSLFWLDRVTTRETAFDRVLEYLSKKIRESVKMKLNRSVDDYCNIDHFASIDLDNFFNLYEVPKPERNLQGFDFNELLDYYERPVPKWLVGAFRCCKIGLSIQNAIVLHRVIQYCQMELMWKPTSYLCSRRIREITYSLFLSTNTTNHEESKDNQIAEHDSEDNEVVEYDPRDTQIVEYDRKDKGIKKFYVSSVSEIEGLSDRWDIDMLPNSQNEETRLHILLAAVDYKPCDLFENHIFSNLTLVIVCMVCTWVKNANPRVSKSAVMSLLITILYLNIRALQWYKNKLKKDNGEASKPCVLDDIELAFNDSNKSQIVDLVTRLERYARKPEKKDKKAKDYRIIHGFSQFQAILLDTIQLNQLLACPLPLFSPGYIYSGTMVYNLCTDLDYRSKPEQFIGELLIHKSPVHKMFTNMLQTVVEVCTGSQMEDSSNPSQKKAKRRKAKKNAGTKAETQARSDDSDGSDPSVKVKVTSDLAMDNRFALLNID